MTDIPATCVNLECIMRSENSDSGRPYTVGVHLYLHSGKDFFYRRQRILLLILKKEIGREGGKERENETLRWEWNTDLLPLIPTPTGDWTHSLGMWPDCGLNLLMYGTMLQPAEPPGQGWKRFLTILKLYRLTQWCLNSGKNIIFISLPLYILPYLLANSSIFCLLDEIIF